MTKKTIEVDFMLNEVVDVLDVDLVGIVATGVIIKITHEYDGAVNYGIDYEHACGNAYSFPISRLRPHVPNESVSETPTEPPE